MASGAGGRDVDVDVKEPRKIQRLEEAVVNRIAAGEARKASIYTQFCFTLFLFPCRWYKDLQMLSKR